MKKISFLFTPLLALGLFGDMPVSHAQEQAPELSQRPAEVRRAATRARGRRSPMERMKAELELSGEQVQKIQGIFREARKKSIKLRADLRVARIELGELVTQQQLERSRVDAKVEQIGQLSNQRLRLQTDALLQTRDLLNAEQRIKAERWLNRFVSGGGRRGRYGR